MRKALLGLGILAAVALIAPRAANAHVSVAIGLPGFGLFVGGPAVVYAPPVYAPPVYYRPVYPVAYTRPYCHDHGRHLGWYKHGHGDDWGDRDDD